MQFSIPRFLITACIVLLHAGKAAVAFDGKSDPMIGDYLSARVAAHNNEYRLATEKMLEVYRFQPSDPHLLQNLLRVQIGAGDLPGSLDAAMKLETIQPDSDEVAVNMLAIGDFADGNFSAALERYENSAIELVPAFETILSGWTHHVSGNSQEAEAVFSGHDEDDQLLPYVRFHHALVLALQGNHARADELVLSIREIPNPQKFIPASLVGDMLNLRVQLLAAQGRIEEAREVAVSVRSGIPDLAAARLKDLDGRLSEEDTFEFDFIENARDGVATFVAEISRNFTESGDLDVALIYARYASFLNPDNSALTLEVGDIFQRLRGWSMAESVFDEVPASDPLFNLAEIGRAEALYSLDRVDEAIDALEELSVSPRVDADVHVALGNIRRYEADYERALLSYDSAVALIENELPANIAEPVDSVRPYSEWTPYYYRGVALERLGRWEESKSEFRRALTYSGENPYVLNYLGYTLADKNEELEEARDLIANAVEQMPDNGAFVDSLGWVLFKLGEYEEAVEQMEKAIQLEPHDPVVIDHLGDVYWMVGRKREAGFQWRRALAYDNEISDEARIMKKLEVGLDEVLAAEDLEFEELVPTASD